MTTACLAAAKPGAAATSDDDTERDGQDEVRQCEAV